MGRYCERQGVEGVVIDGFTRDSFSFKDYNYGIFFRGTTPLDIVGRGSVKCSNQNIYYDNFTLKNGDFVFSDVDATVIVPAERLGDLYQGCVREIEEEMLIKRKIDEGMSIIDIIKNSKPL
jgi:regulator of RNase E activity RraA